MLSSKFVWFILFSGAVALLLLPGCEKTGKFDSEGKLTINITDGPFKIEYVESAKVTISSIELRKANVSDTIPFITVMESPQTIDLMKLRNGLTEILVQAVIPSGKYDQIRILTSEASLKIKDGGLFTLKIPSGSQSGIKINVAPPVEVEGGLTSELLLDFDLSKSFVMKGNLNKPSGINGFNFKPVIRAVNTSYAGSIEGKVTDISQNKIINASVLVLRDTVFASAFTDTTGSYKFIGIPSGTYRMLAAMESFDTLVFEGVKVVAGNRTTRNFSIKAQ